MNNSKSIFKAIQPNFLIEMVENQLNISSKNFTIKTANLVSATEKNDNFISEVYCLIIQVEIPDRTVSVIIKASENVVTEMKQLSVFSREQLVYEDMITSFERIWKENGNDVEFAPKCLKILKNPYEIIALEDLKVNGYEMADKKHGLNLQQTKAVLGKIARFHAASAVRYLKDKKIIHSSFDRVSSHVTHSPDSPIIKTMNRLYNQLIDLTSFLGNSLAEGSKPSLDVLMNSYFDVTKPMKCGLRVFVHADLWTNNIFFKNDCQGNVIDAKIIDFQMCFWGSPNADLIYLLFTSVRDDVKVKYFDEIIEFYYEELRESLKVLKYGEHVPTVQELKEDLMENRMYAFQLFLHIIPMTRSCASSNLEPKDFFSNTLTDEKLKNVFLDDNFVKVVANWLPFMKLRGFLDVTYRN